MIGEGVRNHTAVVSSFNAPGLARDNRETQPSTWRQDAPGTRHLMVAARDMGVVRHVSQLFQFDSGP